MEARSVSRTSKDATRANVVPAKKTVGDLLEFIPGMNDLSETNSCLRWVICQLEMGQLSYMEISPVNINLVLDNLSLV